MKLPQRREVKEVIHQLLRGEMSREQVSEWACRSVVGDDVAVDDFVVWGVLKALLGADLISTDRPYLYGNEDFKNWLAELES